MSTIHIIWLVFVMVTTGSSFAQESPIATRSNIKFSRSKTPLFFNRNQGIELRNLRAEYNYGINNYLELGGYIGYNRFDNAVNQLVNPQSKYIIKSNAFFYGINSNLHLLPFIFKEDEVRFDLYLAAKLGAISMYAPEGSSFRGHQPDYGLSVGLAFYLTSKWGIYAEYGFAEKLNPPSTSEVGVSRRDLSQTLGMASQ